jgi:hypothetical protein
MPDPNRFRDDPLLRLPGLATLAAARAAELQLMDEYGREIFDLWFSGKAPAEVVLDSRKWAAYMQADAGLGEQIDRHLTKFALRYRDDFFLRSPGANPVAPNQLYRISFHAEVGSTYGGYLTGYAQLHGSNRDVGDFQMEGMFSMAPAPGSGSELEFTFTNNLLIFNDKVDPNYKYNMDDVFANLAKKLGAASGGAPPKDYIVRIRWREPGPWTYRIPAAPSKPGAPDWLPQFPGRP